MTNDYTVVARLGGVMDEVFPTTAQRNLWLQRPHPALNRQSPAQAIAAGNSAAVLRILEFLQQPEIKPTKPARRGGTRKGTQQ
jgi:uncharacterized protein (DUF2384 family)